MAATTLSEEMLEYFDRLTDAEQRSVLQLIKTFAGGEDEFKPQTIEEYNRELEEADAEIEAGNFVPHEEVMKKYLG
jgi:predicted transcriptional regulator